MNGTDKTTESELRELLVADAGSPGRPREWDQVVARGRRHRRVARARNGIAASGLAALAVLGVISVRDLGTDGEGEPVIADQPNSTTSTTDGTTTTAPMAVNAVVDLTAARAGDHPEITLLLDGSDAASGYDPCSDTGPLLEEGSGAGAAIRITVVPADQSNADWSRCSAHPFGSTGTVRLDEPVHGRQVIDGSDGTEVRVVDENQLLWPREFPAFVDSIVPIESGGEIFGSSTLDSWTFSWLQDDLNLNLSRWSLAGEHPEGCAAGEPVDIRGFEGRACRADGSAVVSLVSWTEAGALFIVELSDIGGNPLPDDVDLIRFAQRLMPYADLDAYATSTTVVAH